MKMTKPIIPMIREEKVEYLKTRLPSGNKPVLVDPSGKFSHKFCQIRSQNPDSLVSFRSAISDSPNVDSTL